LEAAGSLCPLDGRHCAGALNEKARIEGAISGFRFVIPEIRVIRGSLFLIRSDFAS